MLVHSEVVKSRFNGTIIDIETCGDFCSAYEDSRRYRDIIPFIFGYIDGDGLKIHCVKKNESLKKLKFSVAEKIPDLKKPLFAFNCDFERGVLYHAYGIALKFDGELNKEKYERKSDAIALLRINNYDDPFNDIGRMCKESWGRGKC